MRHSTIYPDFDGLALTSVSSTLTAPNLTIVRGGLSVHGYFLVASIAMRPVSPRIGANQFRLGQDMRLGGAPDVGDFGSWRDHEPRGAERRQPEVVMVRAMASRRAWAIIIGMTKVVDALI